MIDGLIYFLYSSVVSPLGHLLFRLLGPLMSAKARKLVRLRGEANPAPVLARPLWVHASSGEIEYAKPVLRELRQLYPDLPILLTYSSPSALALLPPQTDFQSVTPMPEDTPQAVRRFLNKWNPRLILFARTDVWPVLADEAYRKKIPMLLFAATISKNSSRSKGLGRILNRRALQRLDQIHCVSKEDQQVFQEMGITTPLLVAGDTRYDQVFARLTQTSDVVQSLMTSPHPTLVAGSTWPEDEVVLFDAIKAFTPRLRWVLAPHEISEARLQSIERNLKKMGVSSQRLSQFQSWSDTQVVLVDQFGLLALIYKVGQIAFVGGSFREKVHSVMEPLAAGCRVLTGPLIDNNREALLAEHLRLSEGGRVLARCHSSEEFIQQLGTMLEQPTTKPSVSSLFVRHQGATKLVLSWVAKALN